MNNYIYKKMTFKEINTLLKECTICVLSLSVNDIPYSVPMYYKYNNKGSEPIFTLESKNQGQKITFLKQNEQVCIFVQFSEIEQYRTVIANGIAKINYTELNSSYNDMTKIIVCVQDITGRIYTK